MDLNGRVALVTGGARGLGRAVALSLASQGARVAVLSLDTAELVGLRSELHAMGQPAWVGAGDVSDRSAVEQAHGEIEAHLGRPTILVNNAAVVGPARFLEDADPEAWRRTLEVNLTGAYLCTRAVLPDMLAEGWGKIVSISSGLGRMAFPRFCAYAVSKAGVIQFTRSLSEECKGRGVDVNAVDPDVMDTPMQAEIRSLGPEVLGEAVHRSFMEYWEQGDLRDPAEVAQLVVWLCSSRSDGVSGVNGTLSDFARLGWQRK